MKRNAKREREVHTFRGDSMSQLASTEVSQKPQAESQKR